MAMQFPDCPEGRNDCRLAEGGTVSTTMAWTPEYDRDGRLLNEDPNTHTTDVFCRKCGYRWARIAQGDDVRFEEREPLMWSRRHAQTVAETQGQAATPELVCAIGGAASNTLYEITDNGSLTPTESAEVDLVEQIKAAILEDKDYLRKLARKLIES